MVTYESFQHKAWQMLMVTNTVKPVLSKPALKCYYDQKITFIFSSDFETIFIKHSPSEIISLNFEKKTVNLNCNFPV